MTSGHPDWQTWSGRSVAGETMLSYSFDTSVPGESTGYFDLPSVDSGYQYVYQNITVSCNNDDSINSVTLSNADTGWVFFRLNFVTGGIYDFPGQSFSEGSTVRVTIVNNSASSHDFQGAVNYVKRTV